MGDPGVAAFGPAGGPAHQLDAAKPLVGSEFQYLFQAQVPEDRTDKTQLHVAHLRRLNAPCVVTSDGMRSESMTVSIRDTKRPAGRFHARVIRSRAASPSVHGT